MLAATESAKILQDKDFKNNRVWCARNNTPSKKICVLKKEKNSPRKNFQHIYGLLMFKCKAPCRLHFQILQREVINFNYFSGLIFPNALWSVVEVRTDRNFLARADPTQFLQKILIFLNVQLKYF